MNSSTALMNNATGGLSINTTTLTALPPPSGLVPSASVHNVSAIKNVTDALPVSTPLHPTQLTYADRHGHELDDAHADSHELHEPTLPFHAVAHHRQHDHHAGKDTTLELQPCNKHDPNQLEIVLFSHQQDHYRPVDGDDEDATRSPTALLIGCTSRLNSGKLAYKIDPAFHSIGSRAKYANYVRKRKLSAAANDKRDQFSDDAASTCNSASDKFDPRCSKASGVAPLHVAVVKRMMGSSPDDNVNQLDTRAQNVSPGSLLIKRAIAAAEAAKQERSAKRAETDNFIRRWASGNEQPRAFEPLDEPLMLGRDIEDDMPLETRSLGTVGGHNRRVGPRLMKRNIAGGNDEQELLEERARASTTNAGVRPEAHGVRLLKRSFAGHNNEQDQLEERARVSTTNGGAAHPRKRNVAVDGLEKRSTTTGGNNGYAGYVGRWNRRALSVGAVDEGISVQRRSPAVAPRMRFVRRSNDADFDKRSGNSGGSGRGWRGRRWRREVTEADEQLEKRSNNGGGSHGGWGGHWRRDVMADDQVEKRSHGGSSGGWGNRRWRRDVADDEQVVEKRSRAGSSGGWNGRRWRRDVLENDTDNDAMTVRSVLSAHGDIFPRGADGAEQTDSVV